MDRITFEEMLEKFDPEVHPRMKELWSMPRVTHMVMYENMDMCSSRLGQRAVVIVGKGFTLETLDDVKSKIPWLNDLPSMRQYPQAFCQKQEEQQC